MKRDLTDSKRTANAFAVIVNVLTANGFGITKRIYDEYEKMCRLQGVAPSRKKFREALDTYKGLGYVREVDSLCVLNSEKVDELTRRMQEGIPLEA